MSDEINTIQTEAAPVIAQPVPQIPDASPEAKEYYRKSGLVNGLGIAALIFSFTSPLIGLILGIITLADAKKGLSLGFNEDYKAGKTLGTVAVIVSAIMFVLVIVLVLLYIGLIFYVLNGVGAFEAH